MTRRSDTPYTDALFQDLEREVNAMRDNAPAETRLASSIMAKRFVTQFGNMPDLAVSRALKDAREIMGDATRQVRLQVLDDVNVGRHHASRPVAGIAGVDGIVRPFHREAGKQRTESCKGSPDAFSYGERDAIRRAKDSDAPWLNPGRNEIQDWSGAAKSGASGGNERRLASSEDLVDAARDARTRTDARRIAAQFKSAPMLHPVKTRSAILAALGQTLDRLATRRVRGAFKDALR